VKLRPVLRLFRIPNVFTAFANAVAGVALARAGAFAQRDLALVAASGSLYLAGMVWNDFCDRRIDAQERPDRPIPAGEVSPSAAAATGSVLLGLGVALAAWHGAAPFWVALALAASILLYDAWLKSTRWGPLSMGACRALNVGLGLSVMPEPALWLGLLPLTLGLFTLLITRLSRFEVTGTAPERLRDTVLALGVLALLVLAALVWTWRVAGASPGMLLLAAAPYLFLIVRGRTLFAPLLHDVSPRALGRAIGGGILLMPALDASFVAASGAPLMAAIVFALAGPAHVLKRWYYLT
jgi:4-hydroxybenzoate polyprenyltransferase